MTAVANDWGLVLFRCPRFDAGVGIKRKIAVEDREHKRWEQKPKEKHVKCKKMQALQRSLSEAQKLNFGVEPVKALIKAHKSTCIKCNSSA